MHEWKRAVDFLFCVGRQNVHHRSVGMRRQHLFVSLLLVLLLTACIAPVQVAPGVESPSAETTGAGSGCGCCEREPGAAGERGKRSA